MNVDLQFPFSFSVESVLVAVSESSRWQPQSQAHQEENP